MFYAAAGRALEEVVGRMMLSVRDHFHHSVDHDETTVDRDFQELSACIQTVSSCESQTNVTNGRALSEAIQQLTECLARMKTLEPRHDPTQGASTPSPLSPTKSKEDAILSLAGQLICRMYIDKANNSRLFQKLKKALEIMMSLQPQTICQINDRVQKLFAIPSPGKGMNMEDLIKVSSLLECSEFIRGFLCSHFPEVLGSVAATLRSELSAQDDPDRDGFQPRRAPAMDACYQVAKVFLRMCQYGQVELQPLLWEQTSTAISKNEELQDIISGLINLLENKRFSKDCGLMAGSSLAMMLNSSPCPQDAAEAVTRLLNRYSQEKSDGNVGFLQIGKVVIRADPFNLSGPSSLVFARLAFIRGVLTCCNKDILTAGISVDQKQTVCLISLFPVICDLCKKADGELKYHSSEALMLYLQAARSVLPALQTDSACAGLFGPNSAHTQSVLRLVWQEWQSPVDGVAELMRSALSTLLDLCGGENQGRENSDSELVDSITSTLLATAWHVKGRYHLLTGLVPRCSAVRLLAAWPSLPGELLRCLGTNYLAAAASELHTALVRRTRAEIAGRMAPGRGRSQEEEELAERWSSVWKQTMLQGLMSKDSLTRYHTSKYWLPSALKTFPGIFRLIMKDFAEGSALALSEGLPDETYVRSLHAQIVLLRYARAKSLLDPDWLDKHRDIISAGLWHLEEDLQADALGLLCCSPKRSELPSPSEMRLLREALPLCLDSESAAFRNQLRHNLHAFVLRLCDGSLVLVKHLRRLEGKTEVGVRPPPPLPREANDHQEADFGKREAKKHPGQGHPGTKGGSPASSARDKLLEAVDWLDWLVEVCFGSLFPGACYQRKRAVLDILGVIFECLLTRDVKKKNTDGSEGVMAWAMQNGKCNLLSERNASLLLECIQDGSNDLRSSSYLLLSTYYPTTLPSSSAYPYTSSSEVLCLALQLVSSPKVQESEAGALLTQMIFFKHSVANSLRRLSDGVGSPPGSLVKASGLSAENGTVHFIQSLLTSLAYQLKCCRKNLLQASSTTPMHGLIRAIRRCLTDQPDLLRQILAAESADWSALIEKLLATVRDITDFILAVLAGRDRTGSSEKGRASGLTDDGARMAPSFGQMGEAIERLIADLAAYRIEEGAGRDGDGMLMTLSEEHQLVLACCWLNLKECSLLLGSLADTMPLCNEDDQGVLTFDQLSLTSDILVDILTRCRHKGAIDGCNQGFAKLCVRLLSSPRPELQAVPKALLDRVLGLVTDEGAGSSFTKKSAGLPLLVESIVGAEPRGRERPLLAYVMGKLMLIAGRPLPPDPSDRLDLPQSHALNIMMALFRCSAVGTDILRYCSEAVELAIGGFASPCWTIRNGSMRLFGTLIARIFGQKKVQDEHSQINAMSATTFFACYPELRDFLLSEVGKFNRGRRAGEGRGEGGGCGRGVADTAHDELPDEPSVEMTVDGEDGGLGGGCDKDNGRLFLHPSLHPVLTLLSKLGPGVGSEDVRPLCVFMEPVKRLAGSAVCAVRELAARALVPLVPPDQMPGWIVAVVEGLPPEAGSVCDYNRLHGDILQVQRMFEAAVHNNSVQLVDLTTIQARLEARMWIAGGTNPCAVIRALYVNMALAVIAECHRGHSGSGSLTSAMKDIVQDYLESTPPFQIGRATLNGVMSTAHLSLITLNSEALTSDLLTSAQTLLTSRDPDVQLATLSYLHSHIGEVLSGGDGSGIRALREKLTDLVADSEQESRCLEKSLALWTDLGGREAAGPCPGCQWLRLWNALTRLSAGERGSGLIVGSLPAIGRMVEWNVKTASDRECVDQWCSWMVKYSHPSQSETIRLAAVKSMGLAAPAVWSQIANEHTEDRLEIAVSLLKVLLSLLQDELQDVRLEAAAIVSLRLPRGADCPTFRHLHSNAAQQVLLNYICKTFSWSSRFMLSVLAMLRGATSVLETVEQQEDISGGTHLFEQESANIYAEGVLEAKNLYRALTDTFERQRVSNPEGFKGWVAGWLEGAPRLQAALGQLEDMQDILAARVPVGGTFYGVSSHSRTYQAMYRQLLYTRFLYIGAKEVETDDRTREATTAPRSCIQYILEMPSVHPCLKMELSSLLQLMGEM